MQVKVKQSKISGEIYIPGSKSHTIRAVYIASLANGTSIIHKPLISNDTLSAVNVCKAFGASVKIETDKFIITGQGKVSTPEDVIDVGNSGTTLRIGLSTATLCNGYTIFTGDEQIRQRPLNSLIDALNNLGAKIFSTRENGKAPVVVKGKAKGGETELYAITSQFLTSLLINTPLFENDTTIFVKELNEIPYVDMTLKWLKMQNIQYENDNYKIFKIKGNQTYTPFEETIPGDFSSASFFLGLGALSEKGITLRNLDFNDVQGDKRVVELLKQMGANVEINNHTIFIKKGKLKGMKIDMNDIPDALPIMAVISCFAQGETLLYNVPQARYKETDRIKTMYEELKKMNAKIEELKDGLLIKESNLKGASLYGHKDHRIVMALTVAGLNATGKTIIDTAEAVNITFPNFFELIKQCNGKIKLF